MCIRDRRRVKDLTREPQDALRFMRFHELGDNVLEIREDLHSGHHFAVSGIDRHVTPSLSRSMPDVSNKMASVSKLDYGSALRSALGDFCLLYTSPSPRDS